MYTFFFFLFALMYMIHEIGESNRKKKIANAYKQRKWDEYYRLLSEDRHQEYQKSQMNRQIYSDATPILGILALDAAENGIFSPVQEDDIDTADQYFYDDGDDCGYEANESDYWDDDPNEGIW